MRKPIVAANWKMHKIPSETVEFLKDFVVLAKMSSAWTSSSLRPSLVWPAPVRAIASTTASGWGAKHALQAERGPSPVEFSPFMLRRMLIT